VHDLAGVLGDHRVERRLARRVAVGTGDDAPAVALHGAPLHRVGAAGHDHRRRDPSQARGDACGIRLYVDADNDRAQAVYTSLGMTGSNYQLFEEELARDG